MKLISKELFVPHRPAGGVFPGFIRYISSDKPILLHRYGWVDASDTYDKFADSISTDNGRTWSQPVMALQKAVTEQGEERYAENTAFFDHTTGLLHTITTHGLYDKNHGLKSIKWKLHFDIYNPATNTWAGHWRTDLNLAPGIVTSFSVPIETSQGVILVPAHKRRVDDQGNDVYSPGYWAPQNEALVIRGKRTPDGRIDWQPGTPVGISENLSSRGVYEPAVAELQDGSLIMICRGDNGHFPEKPGYKWLSRSADQGQAWSTPVPLTLADGSPIESAASGSTLFRSIKNGRLYWMGNLCLDGIRANGNWPRHPLVLAEVDEQTVGLKPETFTIIDTRQPGELEKPVQFSNFRYYQDRETGDLVVFLSRFGENHPQPFKMAGYYRYRVAMDE